MQRVLPDEQSERILLGLIAAIVDRREACVDRREAFKATPSSGLVGMIFSGHDLPPAGALSLGSLGYANTFGARVQTTSGGCVAELPEQCLSGPRYA